MNRKGLLSLIFLLMITNLMCEDSFDSYVSKEKQIEAEKIYEDKPDGIFQEPAALSSDSSKAKLAAKFPSIISIVNRNGVWFGSFYFSDNSKVFRKSVKGSGVIRGIEDSYAVTVVSDGMIVREVESGISTEIKIKRR